MMMIQRAAGIAMLSLMLNACGDANEPIAPGENARVEVKSDPSDAEVWLDGTNTGQRTPIQLRNFTSADHIIEVRLDRGGLTYGYRAPYAMPVT